jgi:hypothetical protein
MRFIRVISQGKQCKTTKVVSITEEVESKNAKVTSTLAIFVSTSPLSYLKTIRFTPSRRVLSQFSSNEDSYQAARDSKGQILILFPAFLTQKPPFLHQNLCNLIGNGWIWSPDACQDEMTSSVPHKL